jgi:hypothetical protein
MKKFLAVICFSFLSISFANAGILTLGVSGNAGLLDVTGKESISGVTGGDVIWGNTAAAARTAATATAQTTDTKSDEVGIAYFSMFGEVGLFNTGLRLGMSYVPYALESETTENVRNDNCSNDESHLESTGGSDNDLNVCTETTNKVGVDLEDLMTMYVSYHHDLDLPFVSSVFIKAGIMEADVITRDILASGSQYANTDLAGEFFGIGFEKNLEEQGMFVRLEGAVTTFDSIRLTATNSGTNTNTIDITDMDGATATLSIGKTF